MWGTQGWNQWALQPAMFNDVPHEQIDWAALAKQWIQMQKGPPPEEGTPPLPPPLPTGPPRPEGFLETVAPPPETPIAPVVPLPEPFHPERPGPGPFLPKEPPFWSKPQWEASGAADVDERVWPEPPLHSGKETFDYGHMHDNPPLAMQSIDYNHVSDYPFTPVPVYTPENQYDQYWSQVSAAPAISPMFLKKERTHSSAPAEEDTSQIDAAKRKQLPAWIRDGLEKMEQERLKRLEKERAAKEKAEKSAKTEALRKELDSKSNSASVLMPIKSKFESDSEAEPEEDDQVQAEKQASPILQRAPSPVQENRTEEEKKLHLMLNVRRMLTEILLSVTNSEMRSIAQEVYRKALAKAPARQLASSMSSASVATGLRGLASYGTESEASEAENSDSDEELYRRMREKKKLFALKERKIMAQLDLEERHRNEKIEKNSNDVEKTVPSPEKTPESEVENKTASMIPFLQPTSQLASDEIPFIKAEEEVPIEEKDSDIVVEVVAEESSDSASSSAESGSESSSKSRKKRDEHRSSKKSSRKNGSPPRRGHNSSEHHKRHREYDKSKSSSYKKRKKYKRSDSSSSSESTVHRKRASETRGRRSDSMDSHRHHDGSSRSHRRSDGHSSRSSHKREERYDRRYEEERRHRRSPSPHWHSSKVPKKYRSSRSPSSESSGKKSKKSRNR